jgi:hypothetical protein
VCVCKSACVFSWKDVRHVKCLLLAIGMALHRFVSGFIIPPFLKGLFVVCPHEVLPI